MQGAYAAVEANPIPEQTLKGLRQLVLLLCTQSHISTLCRLPFAGARSVRRQGRWVLHSYSY